VKIRPAVGADAASIAAIMNALLRTTTVEWRNEPYSESAMRAWMQEHDVVIVAEEGAQVVGVAAYGPFRDSDKWPGYGFTVENTVHVREDRWHRGVGRDLMRQLIAMAEDDGKHSMIAAIDGANDASVRFHQALGFAEVARMPEVGAKFGQWLDLVLLQLRLDGRASPEDP
jgi:L-amino acid N-acyltransferase